MQPEDIVGDARRRQPHRQAPPVQRMALPSRHHGAQAGRRRRGAHALDVLDDAGRACGWTIPAVHYMIVAAGGNSIRCAPYRTYGTQEQADVALEALEGRGACLLSNHGMIATGPQPQEGDVAGDRGVETLARAVLARVADRQAGAAHRTSELARNRRTVQEIRPGRGRRTAALLLTAADVRRHRSRHAKPEGGRRRRAVRRTGEGRFRLQTRFPRSRAGPEQDPAVWKPHLPRPSPVHWLRAGARPSDIRGLGIAGQLDGCIAVDADCQALNPGLLWMDRRAEKRDEGTYPRS